MADCVEEQPAEQVPATQHSSLSVEERTAVCVAGSGPTSGDAPEPSMLITITT